SRPPGVTCVLSLAPLSPLSFLLFPDSGTLRIVHPAEGRATRARGHRPARDEGYAIPGTRQPPSPRRTVVPPRKTILFGSIVATGRQVAPSNSVAHPLPRIIRAGNEGNGRRPPRQRTTRVTGRDHSSLMSKSLTALSMLVTTPEVSGAAYLPGSGTHFALGGTGLCLPYLSSVRNPVWGSGLLTPSFTGRNGRPGTA